MTNIVQLLGEEAEYLLKYQCTGICKESLHLPGADYVDRVVAMKDRKIGVLRSLQALYGHGRLANFRCCR
jgi:class I fructose-bisphosphate aldolase